MTPYLADVVVRARGLAVHLLPRETLSRLARSSWSGVLAGALQDLGYWPAPTETQAPRSTAEVLDAAIDYETTRRFGVLARWLAERRAWFAGVFEYEERRALRIWLRRIGARDARESRGFGAEGSWALPRRLRGELATCTGLRGAVRALERARSGYAAPLDQALREDGEQVAALEAALDRAFAARARRAAGRVGGRLAAFVADGIDLENGWDALFAGGGPFIEGGARLSREVHAAISLEPSIEARRRRMARAFAHGSLAPAFEDLEAPASALEARATAARIVAEHRAARIEPLGAAPILELVLRLRAERADLRRINWAVAQGLPTDAILGQMTVVR